MIDKLAKLVEQQTPAVAVDRNVLEEVCCLRRLRKDEPLLPFHSVCRHYYFVNKGALRTFFVEDGQEHTSWFAFEGYFFYPIGKLYECVILTWRHRDITTPSFKGLERFKFKHEVMDEKLILHCRKYIDINPQNETKILNFFQPKTFAKKDHLVDADTKCKFHFFVIKGCLRLFFVNEKGVEQTIQFAIENWWLTDYLAFENQTKTEFTIQAVEATEVLAIDYRNQAQLLKQFPALERYFRLIYQRAYAATQLRTKYLYDFSREQFYHHFNDNFPEFTQRVPQHLLASYLNMTPEYLSEIKNKKLF